MTMPLFLFMLEIKKVLTYRTAFWVSFIGGFLGQFGVAYFLAKAIFASGAPETLQGFTFETMLVYYFMVPLTGRVIRGHEMGFVADEIYDGGLSRFLLYPVSYFRFKYFAQMAQAAVVLLQLCLGFALFLCAFKIRFAPGWTSLLMAVPVFFLSGLLAYAIAVCLEMVSFWMDNVWTILWLNIVATNLLGGGLIPLSFFPVKAQAVLDYLPFTRLVSFPIRCLLGQVEAGDWIKGMGLTALWTACFAIAAGWIWRRGLRHYSGVGI